MHPRQSTCWGKLYLTAGGRASGAGGCGRAGGWRLPCTAQPAAGCRTTDAPCSPGPLLSARSVGAQIGAAAVPGHSQYLQFAKDTADIWVKASGAWSIRATPGGLRLATWSKVGAGGWLAVLGEGRLSPLAPGPAQGGLGQRHQPTAQPCPLSFQTCPALRCSGATCGTPPTWPSRSCCARRSCRRVAR